MKIEEIHLGQKIIQYECPTEVVKQINDAYDHNFDQLMNSNYRLAGKINKEKSLYYTYKGKEHNFLSKEVLDFLDHCFRDYLFRIGQVSYKTEISSIWVNEMERNEYNPMHHHTSPNTFYGLSSVLFLNDPKDFGPEYARSDNPSNGRLEFIGNGGGQFSTNQIKIDVKEGDFYVFPFDLKHGVYPFNSDVKRRTLAANLDILKFGVKSVT